MRRAELAAVSHGGKVYAVGGRSVGSVIGDLQSYDPTTLTGTHFVYNPAKDSWSIDTPLPGGNVTAEVQAISTAGRIFIVGGGIFGSGQFNPTQNIWKCG